jgi:hypothetical protein
MNSAILRFTKLDNELAQVPADPVLPLAPAALPGPLFFPNPACTGLELRDTTPAAFASNEYGFGKCALL